MPSTAGECVFCAIAAGDEPAHVVLDEPHALAFLDRRPLFAGHALLIPRAHHEAIWDLPAAQVGPYFSTVRRLAVAVRDGMEAEGAFVAMNNVVSQSVPHLHTHIVPRSRRDGLRGFFWPRITYKLAGEAEEAAEAIRSALARR